MVMSPRPPLVPCVLPLVPDVTIDGGVSFLQFEHNLHVNLLCVECDLCHGVSHLVARESDVAGNPTDDDFVVHSPYVVDQFEDLDEQVWPTV